MHGHEFSFFDTMQANAEPVSREHITGAMKDFSSERYKKLNEWRAERLELFVEANKARTPCSICKTLVLPHLHRQHHDLLHPN